MTMVLSLDEETSEKIYHIQLKRFIDAQRIRTTYNSDKPMMRTELKKLQIDCGENSMRYSERTNEILSAYKKYLIIKN